MRPSWNIMSAPFDRASVAVGTMVLCCALRAAQTPAPETCAITPEAFAQGPRSRLALARAQQLELRLRKMLRIPPPRPLHAFYSTMTIMRILRANLWIFSANFRSSTFLLPSNQPVRYECAECPAAGHSAHYSIARPPLPMPRVTRDFLRILTPDPLEEHPMFSGTKYLNLEYDHFCIFSILN